MLDNVVHKTRVELEVLSNDLTYWAAGLSNAEKLFGLCLVILVLFALVVRPANHKKRNRSEFFQFGFAMTLVVAAGVSVGWFFDPNFLN